MDGKKVQELDKKYIANTYSRFDAVIAGGEGSILFGSDGKQYIDCASGIGCNVFGVNDASWKEAVIAQLNRVQHVCNLYYSEPQALLAKALCERTGAGKVFFSNSGAEANECAIKTARKYSETKYGVYRKEIITFKNSFHGRTLATLSATGQEAFHKYFSPFVEGFRYAEPDMDGILNCYTDKTCAVMIETVQGEGGVNMIDKDFLQRLDKFCKERDILLIIDEVQTGNGRTGYLYSYEAYGLTPDIVTTAKGLGGGLPLGACLTFGKCAGVLQAGDHGSTFGGNPVACAGALSIIERLDGNLLLEVQGKGAYFRENIARIKNVTGISGMGLMIGVSTTRPAREIAEKCLQKGLIVLTAHDNIRLLPPINIKKAEIDEALKILNEVIGK